MSGPTIGFRFHANEEQLEEVQSKEKIPDVKEENAYLKMMTDILKPEVLDGGKVLVEDRDGTADTLRDQRNLSGKRSISVDSAPESHLSSPNERWKKFSELREKITKTVEEKISEMKIERNVLGKTKLVHSKENSSVSDSEDTSESSKMSAVEQLKDAENQISSLKKASNENMETLLNDSDFSVTDIKKEVESNEGDNELRNRKSFTNFSELLNLPDIKIAVAKNDDESSAVDDTISDDIESGVEADENLNAEETETPHLLDSAQIERSGSASNNPPFGDSLGNFLYSVFSQTNTAVLLVLFLLYIFLPLPEFFKGCLLSFFLMLFWRSFKGYVHYDDTLQHQMPFAIPDYRSMPPLKVPKYEVPKGVWFNEYEEEVYDPDYYSVTHTVPVYLELEGTTLKISRAKGKIRRRATFDEPEYKLPIISKRVFDLKGCHVYLMPQGLARKRLFSKKYPIVLLLKRDSLLFETKNGKEVDEKDLQECCESGSIPPKSAVSPKNKCALYLFARCDRQKEEWYRKFLLATKESTTPTAENVHEKTPEPNEVTENEMEETLHNDSPSKEPTTPFENLCFIDEITLLEEYLHYMATFIKPEQLNVSRSKEMEEGNSTSGPQIQWFNAFINRVLFDVFRSPYWLAKIQEKVQRKLNSIRMPYYIEDIEVIEMDLGKTGPMFHRVSPPYLDERGLWFDMDFTFNGLIRVTIQTQLNLIKLQKGTEENELSSTPLPHSAEKPKKGKRIEKSDRETKSCIHSRDSTEILKKTVKVGEFSAQIPGPENEIPQLGTSPDVDSGASADFTEKLIHEVKQLAEIAVAESLSTGKHSKKALEKMCPCSKEDKKSKEPRICPCVEAWKNRSAIYDSDLEDSAESSSEDDDDDEPIASNADGASRNDRRYPKNRRSSKKIFKVFENVAQSKYFKSVAQSKYIQKAIAGVSAAKLRLTLEIKSCTGIMVINIPPPPSDRFWFGFRNMPTLVFSASPKIGDKAVRFVHIKNYLQKKILYELKKVMVDPNMIDFVLPTSAPARSSSFVQVEEPDMQEGTILE